MIEIQQLVKSYNGKRAVDHLDLKVDPGVVFTFLGPNGAGKTTTMKIMTGLLRPTSGSVLIDGIDIVWNPVQAKSRIGYIPDHPYLYGKLTGWELLHFVGGLYRMREKEVRTRGEEILSVFELTADADRLVEGYSHGMRQRLAFAACFLHDPRVVIIDEPWVGLDPRNIRTAIEYLKAQAKRGVTIFMSTHSLDIAEDVAERVGIIHHGKLIFDGTVDALRLRAGAQGLEQVFLEMTR